jgi:hypothetical protein
MRISDGGDPTFDENDTSHMPSVPRCRICGTQIVRTDSQFFCEQHYEEYQLRQQNVLTTDLSSLWLDTLSTWREPPAELATEPYSHRLKFRRSWQDWLFFWMGYSTRLPDWLVVNTISGKIRRFVEVSEIEVQAVLNGEVSVPDLSNFSVRWGHPDTWQPGGISSLTNLFFRSQLNADRIDRRALTQAFPIYGIAQSDWKLRYMSVQHEPRRPTEFMLTFSGSCSTTFTLQDRQPGTSAILSISSSQVLADTSWNSLDQGTAPSNMHTTDIDQGFEGTLEGLWVNVKEVLQRYGLTPPEGVGDFLSVSMNKRLDGLKIGHKGFIGKVISWSHTTSILVFLMNEVSELGNVVSQIKGFSYCLVERDLFALLEGLVVINQNGTLLDMYEQALSASTE